MPVALKPRITVNLAPARADLAAHRMGWLRPEGWDVAHWFERAGDGHIAACGRAAIGCEALAARGENTVFCARCKREIG